MIGRTSPGILIVFLGTCVFSESTFRTTGAFPTNHGLDNRCRPEGCAAFSAAAAVGQMVSEPRVALLNDKGRIRAYNAVPYLPQRLEMKDPGE